ncbi:MAG: aminopeptidase P N-terminal domain-containing protein [Bacteroidales bacterium]|nr:aminopeptidase P N-terminal domain-containing protein [Bacteroidales bacterium]
MFSKETYIARRKKLASSVESGILVFLGNNESPCNYRDNTYIFRQDSTFLYYFGLDLPHLAAAIDIDSGGEIIFGDDVDIDDIIWMGPQKSIADQAAEVGVGKTYPFARLNSFVADALAKGRTVHYIPQYRADNMILLANILGTQPAAVNKEASVEFIKAIVAQRIIKEPCEIAEIDRACDLGYAMHYTSMTIMKPGMIEQEVVGAMEGVVISGGYMTSFPTILSQHGETLHNHLHDKVLEVGKLCVIDAGAEIASHYCSDFTRTLPVGGKFDSRQKDIYTIVSTANSFAAEMARPGITYREVHLAASRLMLQGLKNVGLVKGDIDEALALGVQGLFMPHGLGHNMGLDVHDMENLGENYVGYDPGQERAKQLGLGSLRMARKLVPGHVITDEPGIYFIPALIEQWKADGKFTDFVNYSALEGYYDFGGIRLEDDILITASGCRRLGQKRLPITVEDVEEAMAS